MDVWRLLRGVDEIWSTAGEQNMNSAIINPLDKLITSMVAFMGLNRESISREQGWILLDMGRKIEQSLLLITMLRVTLTGRYSDQVEYNLQQSVLMSHESLVNYRYKYRMPINNELVLDLMLFDPNNPRSLVYQVDRLKAYLKNLPKAGVVVPEYERLILEVDGILKHANRKELAYQKLDEFLGRIYGLLSAIPEVISKIYFKHEFSKTIAFK